MHNTSKRMFLGNLLADRRPFVEQAAKETGFSVSIKDGPHPPDARIADNMECISVWSEDVDTSHEEFWLEYYRQAGWGI